MHLRSGCAVLLAVALGVVGLATPSAHASNTATSMATIDARVLAARTGDIQVIVQKSAATDRGPEAAISSLGGTVTRDLPIVDGFAATIPATATGHLSEI